jgi:type VI secretion system protein ImpH
MERKSQHTHSRLALLDALRPAAYRVNFYRFCQLLEQSDKGAPLLGTTSRPDNDPVRFRPHPGMGFPVSEIRAIEPPDEENDALPPTVRTTFLGMYGVDSPLPTAYLDFIAQRGEGYEALTSFLDIFHHRITTQYYRIWRKYAYPATYQAGGTDVTSQCLLGLIGLGIPGTAAHIATPISRFLALLSTMRLPTRNAEGIRSLVSLLAPHTHIRVNDYDPMTVTLASRTGLGKQSRVRLSQRAVLGRTGKDVNSRLYVALSTDDPQEAEGWLPGGHLHSDLLVLMRVYLGYRTDARLSLTLPTRLLPDAYLNVRQRIQLGRTGMLGLRKGKAGRFPEHVTVSLGSYECLQEEQLPAANSGEYRFE